MNERIEARTLNQENYLQRSRRWLPRLVAFSAAALILLTACGNRVNGDSDASRAGSVSLVASPIATRPAPTPEIPVCLGGSSHVDKPIPEIYRNSLIEKARALAKPHLINNVFCSENFYRELTTSSRDSSEPILQTIVSITFLGFGQREGDSLRIQTSQLDDGEIRTSIIFHPRESRDPLFRLEDRELVGYASTKINIPPDTQWEDVILVPYTEERYKKGTSKSTNKIINISSNGGISIGDAPEVISR